MKKFLLYGVVGLIALAACSTSEPTKQERQEEAADQSSLACDHFRNVAGDWDIMGEEERLGKLREIYDNAIIATNQVRLASREVLKHYLARDDAKAAAALKRLDRACAATGH